MRSHTCDDLSLRIRAGRLRVGLTQQELAERAGVAVGTLSLIERGVVRRPHRLTRRALLSVLQAPLVEGRPAARGEPAGS
jgi:transcriptional regulator with XRE-family HTH domain